MKVHHTSKVQSGSKKQQENERKKYSKPVLKKLGTITSLTSGGSGPHGDVTGPTTDGNVRW